MLILTKTFKEYSYIATSFKQLKIIIMKKIYVLAFVALGFIATTNAQVEVQDDMEDYLPNGNISTQSPFWRTWSGGDSDVESADVSTTQALSGANSMLVNEVAAPAGIDQLLLIDSQPDSGIYSTQWAMYVPSGKEGYWNAQSEVADNQGDVTDGNALFGGNVYYNELNGNPGGGTVDGTPGQTFTFPHDQWFTQTNVYDIDNQVWAMYIDGELMFEGQEFTFNNPFLYIGAIDFYAPSDFTTFYVDDVVLAVGDLTLGTEDFNADVFTVYPNPVVNVLNIDSRAAVDAVVVYDVLGKVVLSANPGVDSPSVDMSSLASGAYLVNVTIGDASKTIKVIK